MDENAATESPMWNGDGVTSADDQTPFEEESMTTTVLKGDDSRINWPGSEGDSDVTAPPQSRDDDDPETVTGVETSPPESQQHNDDNKPEGEPSSATEVTESGGIATSGEQPSPPVGDMDEQKDTDETTPSADDTSDPIADDIPPPAFNDIPAPALHVADIPDPVIDDDIEPELEALAENGKEGSPESDNDKNTLGLPEVQIIVTPGTPVPDSCESPTDFTQERPSTEEDDSSYAEEPSPQTPGDKQERVEGEITAEETFQQESSPEGVRDAPAEHQGVEETAAEEQKSEDPLAEQPDAEDATREEASPEENVTEEIKEPNGVEQETEEPAITSPEEQISDEPVHADPSHEEITPAVSVPLESALEEQNNLGLEDDDLVKPPPEDSPELEKVEDEEDTDSPTISEGGSTPKHVLLDDSVDLPPQEENRPGEVEKEVEIEPQKAEPEHAVLTEEQPVQENIPEVTMEESEIEPQKAEPEYAVFTEEQPVEENIPEVEKEEGEIEQQKAEAEHAAVTDEEQPSNVEEHIPYPETKEDPQSEALNGKEPVNAEAFFDEAFASESPDITDEPEVEEDKPPPVQEEAIAQTVKTNSDPSIDFTWPSEKTPETPTETQPTVTEPIRNEPEKLSTQSEKMGVKGEHVVDGQHKNKEDRMTGSDKENDSSQRSIGRAGSKRLDTNRFSHFNKSTEELDIIDKPPKSPVKKTLNSNRLDRSRFAKFEMNNQTNGEAQPKKVTRNFVINKGTKKRFGSDPELNWYDYDDVDSESSDSGQPNSNECCVCKKRVYPMEKITADSKPYHKTCFRCTECRKILSLGNYAALNGCLYCKPHFTQLFKLKGNYNDGFAPGASKSFQSKAQTEEGIDTPDSSPTKNAVSPGASSDNTDIVRAADELEETRVMTSPGGLRSVKDQFEGGNVSNVEVKKMMDEEVIRPTTMQNEESAPEGIHTSGISENEPVVRDDVVHAGTPSDDPMSVSGGTRSILDRFEKGEVVQEPDEDQSTTPSKKVDVSAEIEEAKRREEELQRAEPAVSENEPVMREDVVRADDAPEDIRLSTGGLGSLKDRFEKGAVSNIEDAPKKDPVKIGHLEDFGTENAESSQGTVSENTPVVRDDVIHASDQADDPEIKTGTSRSLKAMFEKGGVSNIEDKPKEKVDISSRSLGDSYTDTDGPVESGISENIPIERDDVVKSSSTVEEPGIKVGGLRNLRSLFEKGNVTNVEEKPRQVNKQTPSSLDSMNPSDGGVSENTPEVRDDLVRETKRDDDVKVTAGHSRSLRNKWEKGEVERPEATYKTVISKEDSQVAESKPEPQREDVVTGASSAEPVQIEEGKSKSLKERFERGEASNAELRVAKVVPKTNRFSACEPDADAEAQQQQQQQENESQQNEAQENGMHQNGGEQMEEQNGIIEDGMSPQEESPQQEMASWEIKAARASALADSPIDGEETLDM